MAMKMMKAPKGTFTTWMAGFGMGVFAICIPFKEIATTGWPRLAARGHWSGHVVLRAYLRPQESAKA